jgi:CheY-like chemotaxis protein
MRTTPFAKLVVVIEDNPLVLEATGGLLRSWGCRVVAAKSCDEALVSLAETEADRQPDLIVCDYQLSRGLTGVNAIERLRTHRPTTSSIGRGNSYSRGATPFSIWHRDLKKNPIREFYPTSTQSNTTLVWTTLLQN